MQGKSLKTGKTHASEVRYVQSKEAKTAKT